MTLPLVKEGACLCCIPVISRKSKKKKKTCEVLLDSKLSSDCNVLLFKSSV